MAEINDRGCEEIIESIGNRFALEIAKLTDRVEHHVQVEFWKRGINTMEEQGNAIAYLVNDYKVDHGETDSNDPAWDLIGWIFTRWIGR